MAISEDQFFEQFRKTLSAPKEDSVWWPIVGGCCGCGAERKEKTDCYFYYEDHDMGATIPCCLYFSESYHELPCEGCEKYFTKAEAFRIIKEHVDGETG